ncbi:MAG: hypothetical protein QJR13_00470 [Bacillota bacterium]|nr:hypothetical protein [Bacillota bacterium]
MKASSFQTRAVEIVLSGLLVAGLVYCRYGARPAWGVLVGAPVGLFNLWLLLSGLEERQRLLQRFLFRLGLDVVVILAALPLGLEFLLGVVGGLLVQILPYFVEFLLSPFFVRVEPNDQR